MSTPDERSRTPACLTLSVKIDDGPDGRHTHFHARYAPTKWRRGTIHRICVQDTDLLFIDTGLPTLDSARRMQQVAGSLGYGFIPGMMGQIAADKNASSAARWMKALDDAKPEQLRSFVATDPRCFCLPAREAYEVRVDPPSVWDLLTRGTECKAKARVYCSDRGVIVLELLTIDDVGIVLAEFPRLFGATCQINVRWDSI